MSSALACILLVVAAQEVDLQGEVVDAGGEPVRRARVEFVAMTSSNAPMPGIKGRYGVAQRRHLDSVRLPVTATDRDGRWRVRLSAVQGVLTTGTSLRFLMQVSATGFRTWQRSVGNDIREAAKIRVVLEPESGDTPLRVRLRGGREPYRGWALIERPFRVGGIRTTWRSDLVEIAADGSFAFDEPPRISGERPANSPTIREEAYRVTVYAADLETVQTMLGAGAHTLDVEPNTWRPRKVLAARAEPAKPPIRASYRIQGEVVVLELDRARVPMLGDESPFAVTTGSGPVGIDTWDPDVPLFVGREATAGATANPEPSNGALDVTVVDRRRNPVFGAGVWVDRQALREAADGVGFAVTDARGHATLRGLPRGLFHVLAHHPRHGTRETLLELADGATAEIRLVAPRETRAGRAPLPGTLLLDLGEVTGDAAEEQTEVTLLTSAGSLIRRRFPHRPRWVRLEGLIMGPTTFYVVCGDRAFITGGAFAADYDAPPVHATAIESRTFELDVKLEDGAAAAAPFASLTEKIRDQRPRTAALLPLQPAGQPGRFTLSARVQGTVWIRVGADGAGVKDVMLPADGEGSIEVTLPKATVKKEDSKKGNGG